MNDRKIKPDLNGAAETMLQSFYARAQYSKSKNHKFYDSKAVEIVEKIDYDFSKAQKDTTMSSGVIARTLVFDELVKEFIDKNPDCTVVNIACGLDTRVYRMDNGKITWYNLDLPETIAVRDRNLSGKRKNIHDWSICTGSEHGSVMSRSEEKCFLSLRDFLCIYLRRRFPECSE